MTLAQYYAIVVKRWKFILICIAVMGLGAYIGSKFITPQYQSTALIQVTIRSGASQADINSLLASDQLVQTEAQLAVSDPVLHQVVSHHTGLTIDQLAKQVTATPRLNTQLFEINVLDPSPTRAASLANEIATTLITLQQLAMQQTNGHSQQQIKQDLDATQAQINTTTAQLEALRAKGGTDAQIAALDAQLSSLQQHYSELQLLLAQVELTDAQNGDFLQIAQPAEPSLKPVQPNIPLNTGAGILTGLLLSLLFTILLEQLDTRILTPETLAQVVRRPILATIWQTSVSAEETVIHPTGRDANAESYRILRTNVGFLGIDKPLHSLIVTSALPRDGKSVVAANLAIFMAKAGKRTLLIDADLRRPTLHEKFELTSDKQGLSNAIVAFSVPGTSDHLSLAPYIHASGIPNLQVMPSGPLPPNPTELLDSQVMQHLFAAITSYEADIVIFDTPPMLGLSDASILAAKVDGTLVVVDITRAKKESLLQVQELLEQANAHVLGYAVNKRRRTRKDLTYGYYYYSQTDTQDEQGHPDTNHGQSPDRRNRKQGKGLLARIGTRGSVAKRRLVEPTRPTTRANAGDPTAHHPTTPTDGSDARPAGILPGGEGSVCRGEAGKGAYVVAQRSGAGDIALLGGGQVARISGDGDQNAQDSQAAHDEPTWATTNGPYPGDGVSTAAPTGDGGHTLSSARQVHSPTRGDPRVPTPPLHHSRPYGAHGNGPNDQTSNNRQDPVWGTGNATYTSRYGSADQNCQTTQSQDGGEESFSTPTDAINLAPTFRSVKLVSLASSEERQDEDKG